MRLKNFSVFGICTLALLFAMPAPSASAHVVQKDGSISGLLHVNPYDLPVQKQPAEITFELTRQGPAFTPSAYGYALTVADATSTVFIQDFRSDKPFLSVPYSFPHDGPFTITLAGVPTNPDAPAFTLKYSQYVQAKDPDAVQVATQTVKDHALHAALPAIFIVAIVIVYAEATLRERRNKRRQAARESVEK